MDQRSQKFMVVGTHRETRAAVRTEIEAVDASDARRIANARGVVVDECTPVIAPPEIHPLDTGASERHEAEYRSILDSLQYRAMKRAAFVGSIWALIAWSVFWLVIGIIVTVLTKLLRS